MWGREIFLLSSCTFRIATREIRFNKGYLSYLLLHHHNLLSFKIIEWEQHTPVEVAFSVQRPKINKSLFSRFGRPLPS